MIDTDTIIKTLAIPVASALIGSFVTTARNEALVTTKLDNLTAIVQESVEEVERHRESIAAMREEQVVLKYRVEKMEKEK